MNWNQIEGNWTKFKGVVQEKWGKLTNDELDMIAGKKNEMVGMLQKKYGYTRDKAEEELVNFCSTCDCAESKGSKSDGSAHKY